MNVEVRTFSRVKEATFKNDAKKSNGSPITFYQTIKWKSRKSQKLGIDKVWLKKIDQEYEHI